MPVLIANEIFGPTIQGEGKSAGLRCIFLRLSGCNLACEWCDTPYTWNWEGTPFKHPRKFNKKKEAHRVKTDDVANVLKEIAAPEKISMIVVSGGEPLLQQARLIPLFVELKAASFSIEVETNGTIAPSRLMLENVTQFNVSPKLANSGDRLDKRIVPMALQAFTTLPADCTASSTFKFVVRGYEDVPEIIELVKRFGMKDVYVMGEGRTPEELFTREPQLVTIAQEHGWNYTRRMHVIMYGDRRGV